MNREVKRVTEREKKRERGGSMRGRIGEIDWSVKKGPTNFS